MDKMQLDKFGWVWATRMRGSERSFEGLTPRNLRLKTASDRAETLTTFLLWNLNRRKLTNLLLRAVRHLKPSVVVLIEFSGDETKLVARLKKINPLFEYSAPRLTGKQRVWIFTTLGS